MKHVHFLRLAAFLLPLLLPFAASGQDFYNGSFEQNGNLCLINASTTVFNANVRHTRSYGSFRKPDIASNDCGQGTAKDGNWFVGIAANIEGNVRSEAITMELTQPLSKGAQYSLTFWARTRVIAPNLEIGQSVSDTTGGQSFYTVSAQSIGFDWTEITVRFTAPNNGKYISIRATNPDQNSGVWLDAFSLHAVFQADNVVMPSKAPEVTKTQVTNISKKAEINNVGLYPNPSEGVFKVDADNNELLSLTVYNMLGSQVEQHVAAPDQPVPDKIDLTDQQPGMYFVEISTTSGEKMTKRIIVSR